MSSSSVIMVVNAFSTSQAKKSKGSCKRARRTFRNFEEYRSEISSSRSLCNIFSNYYYLTIPLNRIIMVYLAVFHSVTAYNFQALWIRSFRKDLNDV